MHSSPNPPLYIAILLYESSSLDPSYTPLFEECFVLLRADNDEQARARAEQHSRAHEMCFNNAAGQEIHWKLKHVVDVSRVLSEMLDDGAELYSRHFKDYGAYHAFEPLLGGSLD
ncbi:DUF4288 domain-containing protein [Sorangium sp. So ce1151]|uniref:DUF4288 domain-containing protein n=1 Tax=Sorangium sp. So ce1151 TaxID=3133332 RepID=UPI003F5D90CB